MTTTVAAKVERYRRYQRNHVSTQDLVWLLEDALGAQVGPFAGELTTPRLLTVWLTQTKEGLDWLFRYMEYPLPPWPEVIGRAVVRIPAIESMRRTLPRYRRGYQHTVYILKYHEQWRQAPPSVVALRLYLDESRWNK